MCFGVKLQIVNFINIPRKVNLITFVPSSPISTILLQLIIRLSPSEIFICVLYEKNTQKQSISYEEEGSAMKKRNVIKKRDHAVKFLAINKSL